METLCRTASLVAPSWCVGIRGRFHLKTLLLPTKAQTRDCNHDFHTSLRISFCIFMTKSWTFPCSQGATSNHRHKHTHTHTITHTHTREELAHKSDLDILDISPCRHDTNWCERLGRCFHLHSGSRRIFLVRA